MTILVTCVLVDQTNCGFHVKTRASNTLKRVCRSTFAAGTYQVELGVETSGHLRASVVDIFTPLSRKQWGITATSAIQLVWVTDCDSTRSALVRPSMGKPSDHRLGITIALRQAIWRRRGEAIGAPLVTGTAPSVTEATDSCRYVDTDALTKHMTPDTLVAAISTNTCCLQQPCENNVRKREKRRQRAAGKDQEK